MTPIFLAALALTLSPLTSPSASDRITTLKSAITSIAKANQARHDNTADVRAELQPLVDELVSLVPVRAEAEKLPTVVGGWQNLWTDMSFRGGYVDDANIYQVVYADGYYYNISRITPPDGEATGFLRGSFVDAGDHLDIEFTRNALSLEWLRSGADLIRAGQAVETGEMHVTDRPGPIGVRGRLQNTYVDEDLRIVIGQSSTDAQDSLFVLTRADIVP